MWVSLQATEQRKLRKSGDEAMEMLGGENENVWVCVPCPSFQFVFFSSRQKLHSVSWQNTKLEKYDW